MLIKEVIWNDKLERLSFHHELKYGFLWVCFPVRLFLFAIVQWTIQNRRIFPWHQNIFPRFPFKRSLDQSKPTRVHTDSSFKPVNFPYPFAPWLISSQDLFWAEQEPWEQDHFSGAFSSRAVILIRVKWDHCNYFQIEEQF